MTMSTTTPSTVPIIPDEPEDPLNVFGELVERNPDVCKRCYTLIRERHEYPWDAGESHADRAAFVTAVLSSQTTFIELMEYIESVRRDERVEEAYPPGDAPSASTACRCGAIETHRTPDTRSSDDAVRAAAGISQTLTELEVNHDWFVLLARVRELKSRPSFAGDDFKTFRRATAQAVHVARHGSVAAFDD